MNLKSKLILLSLSLIFGVFVFMPTSVSAACSMSGTTVTWSTATWSGCAGGGASLPGTADTVVITNGQVVTEDTTVTISGLTMNGTTTNTSVTLSSSSITLTLSSASGSGGGILTLNSPTGANITNTMAVGAGTLSAVSASITAGTTSTTRVSQVTVSTGILTITTNGITFAGTNVSAAKLTTTGAATINLVGAMTGAGTLAINAATTLVSTGTTSIGTAGTWGILTLNSGTLTLGAVAVTFAGAVNLGGGTLAVSSATGTKTFTGAVTCTTGSFDLSGFATVTSFGANITANCTTFNTGTGTATLSGGAGPNLAGSSNITFGGAVTISSGVDLTNNNTGIVTVTGALTFTGNWVQGNNASLTMSSTNSGVGTLNASAGVPNTVTYGATATLKAPTSSYYNLTITAGTITSVTVTVTNNLVVSGGTFSGTTNVTVNGGGVTGDGTITMTGGTFLVDGTGNFGGATAWTFYNLTFGNGSGTTTTTATGAGAITVTNTETIAASQTLDAGSKTWNLSGSNSTPAITHIASQANACSATITCAKAITPTAVNHLLVVAGGDNATTGTITISDTQGVTWTETNPLFGDSTSGGFMRAWWGFSTSTSSDTITLTDTGNGGFINIMIDEFAGTDLTSPFDQHHEQLLASGSPNSGSATINADNEVIWGFSNDSITAVGNINGSAATKGADDGSQDWTEYRILGSGTSGASTSAAFTGSGGSNTGFASFKKLTATQPLIVTGTLTANASTIAFQGDGAITVPAKTYYNLTFSPTITAGRTYTLGGAVTVNNNLDINPTAASSLALTANLGGTLTVTGSITIEGTTSGTSTLDTLSASNYAISAGSINITSTGTFTPQASTITLTGTSGTLFTKAGTFTVGTSTFVVTSASGQPLLLSAATTFHILKINTTGGSTVINANQTITIDDASGAKLWVAAGVLNDSGFGFSTSASTTNTLQVDSGTTLCLGGASGSNTATTCDTGATSTTSRVLPTFQTYTIDSASTIIYLSNAVTTVTSKTYGNLSLMPKMTTGVGSLTYTMPSSTVSIGGNFNIKPTASNGSLALTVNLATATNTVTGTTTIQPDSTNVPSAKLASTSSNYNLSTGKVELLTNGTLDINNATLTITGTSGTLFTRTGTFTTGGTSTTTFSGNGTATLNFGTVTFDAMTNSGTGTKTLGANITATGTLTISAGTLDASASNYDITAGVWSNSGTFVPHLDTLTLSNTGTFSDTTSFWNLIINASGKTVTLGGALTVANNLTITAGTLDASAAGCTGASCAVNVAVNWSNSGTFTARTGTVTLNGVDQAIAGTTTFYNLTKQEATNNSTNKTLTFASGTTQTITHTLTLDGLDANDKLVIAASTTSPATINFTGSSTFSTAGYLDVSYNTVTDNSSGITLPLEPANSTDLGNTTGWFSTGTAAYDQKHFRFYRDNAGLNSADYYAAQDTNYNIGVSTIFRLRIETANTGDTAGDIVRRLEFKEDSGSWTQITTGTNNVRLANSSNFVDGAATTTRLTATGTFQAGEGKDTGSDTSSLSLTNGNYTEDEFSLKLETDAAGHAYQFRITNAGVALDTYTVTPAINTPDSTPPVPSSFNPANASTIRTATPNIFYALDEDGDCKASTINAAYVDMSGADCTGDGSTSGACLMPTLGSNGSKTVYFACQDTWGNRDTIGTTHSVSYTLNASSGGTWSLIIKGVGVVKGGGVVK